MIQQETLAKNQIKRICLWSGPRNVSTALMYSFAQRNDCKVYDEPLYGHYLSQTPAKEYHPGAAEILDSLEKNGNKVLEMMMGPQPRPVVFFKNMTHHLLDLNKSFMKDVTNILLTRDPVEMLISFSKVIGKPEMIDVGYEMHGKLLDYFQENNIEPIVIDAKNLLMNVSGVLKKLCDRIGIPFMDEMLSWKPGPLPEEGIWAKYWYSSIHQSSGFRPYNFKPVEAFPEHLLPLLEACRNNWKIECVGVAIDNEKDRIGI